MAIILNIDTAVDMASVCLAKNGQLLCQDKNENKKDHAAWLHPAIDTLMKKTGVSLQDINAIAVTIGPGSYTGLRVGLAAAKGICYALQKPLIAVNTLQVMANAVKKEAAGLICPMIDARRMEVFTALFNKNLEAVIEPFALVLDEMTLAKELAIHKILFTGNGVKKFKPICAGSRASFSETVADASHMISLSENMLEKKQFADIAYTEPFYLKEFYSPRPKPLI